MPDPFYRKLLAVDLLLDEVVVVFHCLPQLTEIIKFKFGWLRRLEPVELPCHFNAGSAIHFALGLRTKNLAMDLQAHLAC